MIGCQFSFNKKKLRKYLFVMLCLDEYQFFDWIIFKKAANVFFYS